MDKVTSLFVEIPRDLKLELERVASERTQAGSRTTLKQVVVEALQQYLEDQADIHSANAALAEGGELIPMDRVLAEFGADLPART